MDNLIKITKEDKEYVWKHYNTNEEEIKENVKIIKEWMRQQEHLPQLADEKLIELLFIRNKCRIESTKSCVDSFYTVRSIYPELYSDLDKIVPSKEHCLMVCPSKLSSKTETLFIVKLNCNGDAFDLMSCAKNLTASQLVYMESDYSLGCRILFDASEATLGHLKRVTPLSLLKIVFDIALKTYKQRLKGIHVYNPPSWINLFFEMIKPLIPLKVFNRISVHSTDESLLEFLEKDMLPSDYGGTNKSFAELMDELDQVYKKQQQFLRNIPKIKTDEKCRVGKCDYDTNVYGVEGTFKKITLD